MISLKKKNDNNVRFGLPHLKALCEEYLQKLGCFEKETILDLYTFSVVYHAKQLEELCIHFISQPETFNYLLQTKQNQLRQLEPAVGKDFFFLDSPVLTNWLKKFIFSGKDCENVR